MTDESLYNAYGDDARLFSQESWEGPPTSSAEEATLAWEGPPTPSAEKSARQAADAALEEVLTRLMTHYQQVFVPGAAVDAVMADLSDFCRYHYTNYAADAREHARREGRREVFLRIRDFSRLPLPQLITLYGPARRAREQDFADPTLSQLINQLIKLSGR